MTPRRQIVLRALDEAFQLTDPDAFPRSKAAFTERLADGPRPRCPARSPQLGRVAVELGAELDKVRAALKALAGKPGAPRAALDDIQSQLAPPRAARSDARRRPPRASATSRAI